MEETVLSIDNSEQAYNMLLEKYLKNFSYLNHG